MQLRLHAPARRPAAERDAGYRAVHGGLASSSGQVLTAKLPVLMLGLSFLSSAACSLGAARGAPLGAEGARVISNYESEPLKILSSGEAGVGAKYRIYTLQRGETLWRVSRRFGTTVQALARLNDIDDPARVAAGIRLKIPSSRGRGGIRAPGGNTQQDASDTADEATGAATRNATADASEYPFVWPVDGTITSRFGSRRGRPHDGVDIGAVVGAEVRAAGTGTVLFAGRKGGYGKLILIRHDNGLVTVYAHNSRLTVRQGQRVEKSQKIAEVGQTGRTTGPHLHFEVRRGVKPRNPLQFLPP